MNGDIHLPEFGHPVSQCRGDALVEAIASRVAAMLAERERPGRWLDPEGVAAVLNVERSFVYEHAVRLGGRRLGDGPRARLRFRLEDVEAAFPCSPRRGSEVAESGTVEREPPRRRKPRAGTGAPLVPIRGENGRAGRA